MEKTIVLGDTHGRTTWKTIVEKHSDAEIVVFIGDYVDTHEDISGGDQLTNLREICDFAATPGRTVKLLVGNHDFQYWPGVSEYEKYSGFQPGMYSAFNDVFTQNQHLFQMCWVDDYLNIFSHAGLTETFLNSVGIDTQIPAQQIEKAVNELFHYQPRQFGFNSEDYSGYGESILQSCIWVRPNSLYQDQIKYQQIVGHTTVQKIHAPKEIRRGFFLIDTLGTSGEYLVIEDGEIKVDKV